MAIYGIGANHVGDVSQVFLTRNLIFIGWGVNDAPELYQYMRALRVGDIVYIKAYSPRSRYIVIKGIGIVTEADPITVNNTDDGRHVKWVDASSFHIPKPKEKNNVRNNTIYEEFHPEVQREILERIGLPNKKNAAYG